MHEENLYAAPKSDVTDGVDTGCRRIGALVFVPAGHDLPRRCIVCNAPAEAPSRLRKMYWHSPWLYLLILVNILIYVVVALIARKSTRVSPGYCADHAARRTRNINIFLIPAALLMTGSVGAAFVSPGPALVLVLGFCFGVLLLIPAIIAARTVWPQRIDQHGASFAGCRRPFLDSLPS